LTANGQWELTVGACDTTAMQSSAGRPTACELTTMTVMWCSLVVNCF